MISRRSYFALLLGLSAALSAPPLPANHAPRETVAQARLAQDIGPDQAAAIVRDRTGGRVLAVRAVQRGGRLVYRVKVLKDGYVRIYHVDGSSGNILG